MYHYFEKEIDRLSSENKQLKVEIQMLKEELREHKKDSH